MSDWRLALELRRSDPISFESIPIDATLTNTGSEPQPAPDDTSLDVRYELRAASDDRVVGVYSRRSRVLFLNADKDTRETEVSLSELAPGEARDWTDDLGLVVLGGIEPGDYRVVARVDVGDETAESEAHALTVHPAHVGRFSSVWSPREVSRSALFTHTDADGTSWLLQHEGEGERLSSHVFRRVREFAAAPDGVALAVSAEPQAQGRWSAGLVGNTLTASCWDNGLVGNPEPVEVALDAARLVDPGFQLAPRGDELFAVGDGVFLVAGAADGDAWVQVFTAAKGGVTPGARTRLGENLPERIAARVVGSGADRALELIWVEAAGPSSRLRSRSLAFDGAARDAEPRLLLERRARVLALAVDPLAPGPVLALLDSDPDTAGASPVVYAEISTDEAVEITEHSLPVPTGTVGHWAISGLPSARGVVLAHAGGQILRAVAGRDSAWEPIVDGVPEVDALWLAASSQSRRVYPIWVDSAFGVRFQEETP